MTKCQNDTPEDAATKLAKEHGISRRTVFRAADFAQAVDNIAENVGDINSVRVKLFGKIPQQDIVWISKNLTPDAQKALLDYEPKAIKQIIRLMKEDEQDEATENRKHYNQAIRAIKKIESKEMLKELVKIINERSEHV